MPREDPSVYSPKTRDVRLWTLRDLGRVQRTCGFSSCPASIHRLMTCAQRQQLATPRWLGVQIGDVVEQLLPLRAYSELWPVYPARPRRALAQFTAQAGIRRKLGR